MKRYVERETRATGEGTEKMTPVDTPLLVPFRPTRHISK